MKIIKPEFKFASFQAEEKSTPGSHIPCYLIARSNGKALVSLGPGWPPYEVPEHDVYDWKAEHPCPYEERMSEYGAYDPHSIDLSEPIYEWSYTFAGKTYKAWRHRTFGMVFEECEEA